MIKKIKIKLILIPRYCLYFFFRFDKWHIIPLEGKNYAVDIINYLNSQLSLSGSSSVLEIGCGIGDIIRNLNYKYKDGFDMDKNALRCAKFLSFFSVNTKSNFHYFIFPSPIPAKKFDTIILINWIHNIAPPILKMALQQYFAENLSDNGIIVIDTVNKQGYKYNHAIEFLFEGLNYNITTFGPYENNRKVHVVQKGTV